MDSNPSLVDQLRHAIASAVANEKAYDVPAVCTRIGLESGTEQEAFSSKYRYVSTRLKALPANAILGVGERLILEVDAFEVSELILKIKELNGQNLTLLTRRKLRKLLANHPLSTEVDEIEFISSVLPVDKITAPIQGAGYTLRDDLYRHMVRNDDLSAEDVLDTIGFMRWSRAQLFKFLEAIVSPEFRDEKQRLSLVSEINEILKGDGYSLRAGGYISGHQQFKVGPCELAAPSDHAIGEALEQLDEHAIHARWKAAIERRATDPEGAITLSRTLLEDVSKWILHSAGESWEEKDDLPRLYRRVSAVLALAPDNYTEQVFKQILGSCQSIVESLGTLRNRLGDAHSGGPLRARPKPRHAELAVNLAGTMSTFLMATWNARQRTNEE